MISSLLIWIFVLLAIICANLPFFVPRPLLLCWRATPAKKAFIWVCIELGLLYLLCLLLANGLEMQKQAIHTQDWEFYVITLVLFILLAYPGFCWRFLWRPARQH